MKAKWTEYTTENNTKGFFDLRKVEDFEATPHGTTISLDSGKLVYAKEGLSHFFDLENEATQS